MRRFALARHVPRFPWSASGRWSPSPASFVVLVIGLWVFGLGDAMLIDAKLGNAPWSVLAAGVARHTPLTIGTATIVIAVVVLLGWIPIHDRPGLGTIANAILIGTSVSVMGHVLPGPDVLGWRIAEAIGGILLIAIGGALYLSTQLGPGPRDGWMTGLSTRLDQPIARVRVTIEATVLVVGWALGGRLGVATFAFAIVIGHGLAFMLGGLAAVAARPEPSAAAIAD